MVKGKSSTKRSKQGAWGIFGIRREKVKDIERRETLRTLKRKRHEEKLAQREELYKAQAKTYKAKAEREKFKKAAARPKLVPMPRIKIRKKKQGRKLTQKRPIGLI